MKHFTLSTIARMAAAGPFPTFSIPQGPPLPTNVPKVPTLDGGVFPLPTGLPTQGPPMPTLYPKTPAINGLMMPTLYPLGNDSKVPEAMKDYNHDALASAYPSMAGFPDYVSMANGSVLSPTKAAQWDWDLSDFVPVYNGSIVSLPTPTIPTFNIDALPTAFITAFPSFNVTGDKDVHIDPPTIVSDPEKNEYIVKVKGHINETAEFIQDIQNNLPFLLPPDNATSIACPSLRPQPTKYCHPEHCHNGHCHEKHCHKKQEIDDLQKVDPNWVWSSTSTDGPKDINPCSQNFQRAHRQQVSEAMARLHQNGTQNATQPVINRRRLEPVLLNTSSTLRAATVLPHTHTPECVSTLTDNHIHSSRSTEFCTTRVAAATATFRSAHRLPMSTDLWKHHTHSTRINEAYFDSVAATNPAVLQPRSIDGLKHPAHSTRLDEAYFDSVAATNPAVLYVTTPYPRPTVSPY